MKLKHILLTAVAVLISTASFAVPAKPGAFQYTQPDGSVIRLERHGDEFFSWTTLAGTSQVVVLGEDGFWHKGSIDPLARKAARKSRQEANRFRVRPRTHNNDPMTHGERHIPVFLVNFSDLSFKTGNPATEFNNLLNQHGYSTNGGTGSVQDFYVDNSHGAFTPIFDVYGPVTLPEKMSYYGKNAGNGDAGYAAHAVRDAAQILDPDVDFSQYDYDNDGLVDMVLMYYAGYNEAEGGSSSTIWPHQWDVRLMAGDVQVDGKVLGAYFCTSELKGSYGTNMCGIGTTCHEFGHSLGLPDFYDTDYEDNGENGALYWFSTMCSGSYNNEGRTPPYFNSEERIILGWMTDDDVPALPDGTHSFGAVHDDIAYRSYTDTEGEYFLYECRDRSGWDNPLPEGLLVYHVDKSKNRSVGGISPYEQWANWDSYNTINAYGDHPCFYVVPAGDPTSLNYSGYYLNDWVFPGTGNVTSYTPIDWENSETGVSITGISYSGGKVTLTCSTSYERKLVGKVTGQDGLPISGVYISLAEPAPQAPRLRKAPHIRLYECTTDADGLFTLSLEGFEGNSAHLTLSKNGYVTIGKDIALSPRITNVSLVMLMEGETEKQTYSYYDPTADRYIFGDGQSSSLMAAIHITADELPENGGRLVSVTFPTLWTAKAYYVILDAGAERLLTYEIPGLGPNAKMEKSVTVELGENATSFPAGTDLYVGIAVEEANAYSGYEGYLFYVTPQGTTNCYLSDFSKEQSDWSSNDYSLVLSASIVGTDGSGPGDDPENPWTLARMGFNSIADPGNGSYAAGESFPLELALVEGVTATAETWTYDGQDVTGSKSVSLTAGTHKLTAKVSLSDGSKETLRLVLSVE